MLNADVDVVPPGDLDPWGDRVPFSGTVSADAVYRRGGCDMKAGLAAALWTVRPFAALEVPPCVDLIVDTVVGEEDRALGTYAMLRRGWRDACVIPEPTSLDVAPGTSGALTFRLTVRGHAAHASRRTSEVSAIEKFIPSSTALCRLEARRNAVPRPCTTAQATPASRTRPASQCRSLNCSPPPARSPSSHSSTAGCGKAQARCFIATRRIRSGPSQ